MSQITTTENLERKFCGFIWCCQSTLKTTKGDYCSELCSRNQRYLEYNRKVAKRFLRWCKLPNLHPDAIYRLKTEERRICCFVWCERTHTGKGIFCSRLCEQEQFFLEIKNEVYDDSERFEILRKYSHKQLKVQALSLVKVGEHIACTCCGMRDLELLEINHNKCDGWKDRKRWKSYDKFLSAIVKGTRKTIDLCILCSNCHHKWHRGAKKSMQRVFENWKTEFYTSLSNTETSYSSIDLPDSNESLMDDERWPVDYKWLEDYENRRTTHDKSDWLSCPCEVV